MTVCSRSFSENHFPQSVYVGSDADDQHPRLFRPGFRGMVVMLKSTIVGFPWKEH